MPSPQDTAALRDDPCLAILGELTQYSDGGAAVDVVGIFTAHYVRVDAGRAGVQSSGPAVFYKLSDLPSDPQVIDPSSIVVDGTSYKVAECKKDGEGGVLLLLHRL